MVVEEAVKQVERYISSNHTINGSGTPETRCWESRSNFLSNCPSVSFKTGGHRWEDSAFEICRIEALA